MTRFLNPETSQPVRVYCSDTSDQVVVCVKRYPSIPLSYHQLQQLQYLLGVEPGLLDTAQFLRRELGDDASGMLKDASRREVLIEDEGAYYGV
jgi:hypothetical protein